jgi:hypothetical protein
MTTFGFGQQPGQIVQMACVVRDIRAAIAWWVGACRVGPWFLIEGFAGPGQVYRGQPSTASVSIAMAFAGHMSVELVQPEDERPSVYKEIVDRRGYGFHHLGIGVTDADAERAAYEARGYQVAFSAPVPSGGSVYYMDDGRNEPGFIELIPATAGFDDMLTRYWKASIDWNGANPIRPFG